MHADELWQEYDYDGSRLGSIAPADRDNPNIKLFGGAAVMLYRYHNGEIEVLFQHRSKFIDRNADKWDVSAGGHVNFNEPQMDAAIRETEEEIGIRMNPKDLEFAASYVQRNHMLVHLYFYDYTGKKDDFHFDDKEVSEVKWVPFSKLVDFWPNLKPQAQNDAVFQTLLLDCIRFAQEKYGNSHD